MRIRFARAVAFGVTLWLVLGLRAWAQQQDACPIVSNDTAAAILGSALQVQVEGGALPGLTTCVIVDTSGFDYFVSRYSSAFTAGDAGGTAEMAARYLPQDQPAPITTDIITGLGDAALLASYEEAPGTNADLLLVQHGSDVLALTADDAPGVRDKLSALAQAALSNQ